MNKQLEIMILQNGEPTGSFQVTQAEWESINYVDYLELDSEGNLHPDFASHGEIVCNRMRALLAPHKGYRLHIGGFGFPILTNYRSIPGLIARPGKLRGER